MSGDLLDSVGQGDTWYGYRLSRLNDPSSREGASGDKSGYGRQSGLMADQLFGGVASLKREAEQMGQDPVQTITASGQYGQPHEPPQQHQHAKPFLSPREGIVKQEPVHPASVDGQYQQQREHAKLGAQAPLYPLNSDAAAIAFGHHQQQQPHLHASVVSRQQQMQFQHELRYQQLQQQLYLRSLVMKPPIGGPPHTTASPPAFSSPSPPFAMPALLYPPVDLQTQAFFAQQQATLSQPPLPQPLPPGVDLQAPVPGFYTSYGLPNPQHPVLSVQATAAAVAKTAAPAATEMPSLAIMPTAGGVHGLSVGGNSNNNSSNNFDDIGETSGLGLWGWCFPTLPVEGDAAGTEATTAVAAVATAATAGAMEGPGTGVIAGGGCGVGSLPNTVNGGVINKPAQQEFLGKHHSPEAIPPREEGLMGDWERDVSGGIEVDGSGGSSCSSAGSITGSNGGHGGKGAGVPSGDRREEKKREEVVGLVSGGESGGGKVEGGRGSVTSETTSETRRLERNAREKRRSLMTSQQIEKLRKILLESSIQTKPNKVGVLSEVRIYLEKLEQTVRELELERQRWMAETADGPEVVRRDPHGGAIDCKQVFSRASVALAMANVEGRLMESNLQFEALSGYGKLELKQLTLLSLTSPSELQETFEGLSAMLTDGTGKAPKHVLAKAVLKTQDKDLSLSFTLARDALGRPKFFLCSLLPSTSATSTSTAAASSSACDSEAAATSSTAAAASSSCSLRRRSSFISCPFIAGGGIRDDDDDDDDDHDDDDADDDGDGDDVSHDEYTTATTATTDGGAAAVTLTTTAPTGAGAAVDYGPFEPSMGIADKSKSVEVVVEDGGKSESLTRTGSGAVDTTEEGK